ncbi:ATP-binding cassette domain-containing protein [Ktedonosporobacter rubrisoli]|uniref:ATP-binding cassette domain-containing protein n=1 Tax=Ktedonosporobacter rubrisoli TaxID=2509675 RepID=A0A4P6K229_KTERU|nr:ATP-binding cassette domain-containing protein [Ktedonosporobacter rubrisoli]QBD81942.1 ATP-binding cassette domain-containing protein [Ktedonosporobacter rubrisoli]
MSKAHIIVRNLTKVYRVPERNEGLAAAIGSLWRRKYREVEAVRDISFSIEKGEIVGFLGPNGAGKTTSLKMLAGLLYPSSGEAYVAGFIPWKRQPEYLRRMSMVLGNKSQVIWDIPAWDSFRLLGDIYGLPAAKLRAAVDELCTLLDMHEILNRPVRMLSLGQRMKCELVAALLYRPEILFLDEPTLGLDVSMQRRFRQFIADYNCRFGTTVILTSHYMADVEALCPRIILINQGQLCYDGSLQGLTQRFAPGKLLRLILSERYVESEADLALPAGLELLKRDGVTWTLRTSQQDILTSVSHILRHLPIVDLTVEDPPLETVIDQMYRGEI